MCSYEGGGKAGNYDKQGIKKLQESPGQWKFTAVFHVSREIQAKRISPGPDLLGFPERFFFRAAKRADPVFRNIFPSCAGSYSVILIAYSRVIDIATWTFPFLHFLLL
jgi:hypothetical protein